jgi:hypothetical protein
VIAAAAILLAHQASRPYIATAQVFIVPDSVRLGSLGPPVVSVDLYLVSSAENGLDSVRVDFAGGVADRDILAFGTRNDSSGCGALASARRIGEDTRLEYRWPRAPGDPAPLPRERCHLGMFATRLHSDTTTELVARATLYAPSGSALRYDGPPGPDLPAIRIVVTRPARFLGITVLSASLLAAGLAMLLWLARAGNRRDRV